MGGGKTSLNNQTHELICIVPHPRTLRKARDQVKQMVIDEVSPRRIRNYLYRWVTWWTMTSNTWQYHELLQWFIDVCWEKTVAVYATGLQLRYVKELYTRMFSLEDAA